MAGLLLVRTYKLLISPTGSGRSLQHAMMWPSIHALEGKVYTEFSDSVPVGQLSKRVSFLRLVTLCCRGTCHILVRGNHHPLRTAASETTILTVRPLYMLTSDSSQIETYPALANLLPIGRDWLARSGTMSTVCAVSCTGW